MISVIVICFFVTIIYIYLYLYFTTQTTEKYGTAMCYITTATALACLVLTYFDTNITKSLGAPSQKKKGFFGIFFRHLGKNSKKSLLFFWMSPLIYIYILKEFNILRKFWGLSNQSIGGVG